MMLCKFIPTSLSFQLYHAIKALGICAEGFWNRAGIGSRYCDGYSICIVTLVSIVTIVILHSELKSSSYPLSRVIINGIERTHRNKHTDIDGVLSIINVL